MDFTEQFKNADKDGLLSPVKERLSKNPKTRPEKSLTDVTASIQNAEMRRTVIAKK